MNNAARHAPYAHKTTKLVRHPHEEEPDELMLLATERYCHAEHFDRLTMRQYCEAYEILSPQIKGTTIQIVARSLASCLFAPRAVIMALALEPVNISRPILLQSQVLGQLDMLRIIDLGTKHHAMTLAERHDIGPSVVKRLYELASEEVDKALSDNPALVEAVKERGSAEQPTKTEREVQPAEVELRDNTETPSTLVAQAKQNIKDSEGILSAFEFERQVVSELEAFPSADAQTDYVRAAARSDRSVEDKSEMQDENKQTGQETKLLQAAARGGRLGESEHAENRKTTAASATGVSANVSTDASRGAVPHLANSLELIAAAKSSQGMATLMAKASGFSLDTAFQVLEDTSGDTLAVFLKAHDVEAPAASRILMLTFPSVGLSTQNALRAVRFYKTLEVESCLDAVEQWPKDEPKHDEAPRGAHQPYLEESDGVRWAARDTNASERRDVELEEFKREALG